MYVGFIILYFEILKLFEGREDINCKKKAFLASLAALREHVSELFKMK